MTDNRYRIWLNDSLYIPVTADGTVDCPYFEGSLGCILMASSDNGSRLALKIPRLLAETPRENAYIATLLKDEQEAVHRQFGRRPQGLLTVQLGEESVLAHPRQTRGSRSEEACQQDGAFVFVSFQAAQRPQLCAVKPGADSASFSIYPPQARLDIVALLSKDGAQRLHEQLQVNRLDSALVLEEQQTQSNSTSKLNELLSASTARRTWYVGVPAYLMIWGGGTLQEAIDRGVIKDWNVLQHLALTRCVLQGVESLHSQGVLHADIRPANVMYISNPASPADYAVSDYGSFSREFTAIANGTTPNGNTQVGPSIGGLRVSPFYAPERRSGQELESANLAVISQRPGSAHLDYIIHLGWRSDLLEADGTPNRTIIGSADSEWTTADSLVSGDRLRLRNYLFKVESVKRRGDVHRIVCDGQYATIMHERIAVYAGGNARITNNEIVSLPGFTEYRQWSAATDLYGVGSVSLYTAFCCAWAKHGAQSQPGETRRADELFAEMMEVLDSVPYFTHFRAEIGQVVNGFERVLAQGDKLNGAAAAALVVSVGPTGSKTFRQFALDTTNKIVGSTPWIRVLVLYFDRNPVKFILFLHFVLSCMHRSEEAAPPGDPESYAKPFCRSRLDKTTDGGATRALRWLDRIAAEINGFLFSGVAVSEDEIVPYSPKSDFELRLHVRRLHDLSKPHLAEVNGYWLPGLNKVRATAKDLDNAIQQFEESEKKRVESATSTPKVGAP